MQRIPILEVGPVALSATTVIRLEGLIGRRILGIQVLFGYAGGTNTVASALLHIAEMRFIVNDVVKRRVSGRQWQDLLLKNGTMYGFYGLPNLPGTSMMIPFSEAWRQDRDQRDITAFPTVWGGGKAPRQQVYSLRLEIQLTAAVDASHDPTFGAYACVDDIVPDVVSPMMIEWQQWSIPSGSLAFDYSVKQQGVLVALQMAQDTGNNTATRTRLTVDEKVIHDMTRSEALADLVFNGMDPLNAARTATLTDIVLDRDDNLARAVPLSGRTVLLHVEAGGAMIGTIQAVAEVLRSIGG